ncbi:MAG TPA: iron-sulfur cluster repair di-iron protein, ric [Firmicutes bacterium]|nr:iron-sulfur cluster repair di-iron protein, ric [Bacillota bacterium]
MPKQLSFNAVKEKYFATLEQYVPVVARVHGKHHPEFYEVRQLFDAIRAKVKAAGAAKPELKAEFARLREVTDNYTVPCDVCESYEAVYKMLSAIDKAYHA